MLEAVATTASLLSSAFRGLNSLNSDENVSREEILDVEGSFMLHGVLSDTECQMLAKLVQNAVEVEVEDEVDVEVGEGEGQGEAATRKRKARRESQHHTPVLVDSSSLMSLIQRVRPFLPVIAGPKNSSVLFEDEQCLSPTLRLYHYRTGDFSTPHFDKSFTENGPAGHLLRFSAYSMIVYLNDSFTGGHTSFFSKTVSDSIPRSSSGKTPKKSGLDLDTIFNSTERILVTPKQGSILIFPHGKIAGCYPDPLHEGSKVLSGEKTIIRTDLMFKCVHKKSKAKP